MNDVRDSYGKVVHFMLPGFRWKPAGGYKVVYEYANKLAEDSSTKVYIHQTKAFFRQRGLPTARWVFLRSLRAWLFGLARRRRGRPIPWFSLHEDVVLKNWIGLPRIAFEPKMTVVATSVQTAPFVADYVADHAGSAGVYFLQSFEDWAAPTSFVEMTWRLPLHRIVIAPWLQEVGDRLGVRTVIVPNAVDPARFPRGSRISERPKLVAGLVATLPVKRTDLLIDVFREIKLANPEVEFVTFGTCGRPRDLPDWVKHHQSPSLDELRGIYQSARIYVCSSDLEGWHLPPAEALLSGAAIVSTDIGGVRAYAEDCALFSPPGDREGLVRHALKLLDDPELAQLLADRGYSKLVLQTPQASADQFEEQLELALKAKA